MLGGFSNFCPTVQLLTGVRSNSSEVLCLKQEEISVSRSLVVMVPSNAQQTTGQAQQACCRGREAALDKIMPKPVMFPWQTSMKAQPQGIITDVAEIQPIRGKVSEPARLVGWLHRLLWRQITVRAKAAEVLGSTGGIWGPRTWQSKQKVSCGSTEGRAGLGYSKKQTLDSCPVNCTLKRWPRGAFPPFLLMKLP